MQFSALTDLTSFVQNYDNVQRQHHARKAPTATPPVSMAPAPTASVVSSRPRTHNPYSAQVLSVRYHTSAAPPAAPAYTALPPPPPPPLSPLNMSNESHTSSTSSTSASPTIFVRTPVRREYRNGRPVPIFTGNSAQ